MKKTTCEVCLSGIKNIEGNSSVSNATQLVHLKSKGFLIHPDSIFFILVRLIETSFAINANSPNVFDDTVEHFFNNNDTIPFPCYEHKSDIIEYIFTSYLTMRMRQFTFMHNKEKKTTNKVKKKLSKLSAN